ncbi:MAG: DUF4097 family beta strand repeat-containing protein [Chloroflexota bacterium]|nr:DUF4097 family beta strand repeat-containing protein [Chloroflexota bacterium]
MKKKWWIVIVLILLELVVCGGILLSLWAGRTAFEGVHFFYHADAQVEETVEETFVVDGPTILDLETAAGNVTVTGGGTGNEVQVIARLSLWGEDEEDARRQLEVKTTQEGNRITVRVVRPEWNYAFPYTRASRVDFEVRVPTETSLRLVSASGDLVASRVTGTVELETNSGDVWAEGLDGLVSAQSSSGDITLTSLNNAGDLEVKTVSGDLMLRDVIADSLTARSSSGRVQVEGVALDGGLDLENTSGDVTAVIVRATSCRLASVSGDLTLDGGSGPLNLRTYAGAIEVRNGTEAELMLGTTSGEIRFSGSLDTQEGHRVESTSGDVRLVLPADTAFDLDIKTDSGDIQTDFAVTMTDFDRKHVTGEVNGGGPLLQINTSSGDIALERMTSESD